MNVTSSSPGWAEPVRLASLDYKDLICSYSAIQQINATGAFSSRIEIGRIGANHTVFRKTLARPIGNKAENWANEALFYIDLRDKISWQEISVPKLRAVSGSSDTIDIYIDFLPDLKPLDLAGKQMAARILGQFAGSAHLAKIWHSAWPPIQRLGLLPEHRNWFRDLANFLPPGALPVKTLELSWEHLQHWQSQYRSGIPTLCHGDVNHQNVFQTPDGRIVLIDWARVSRGPAGADLAQLIQPGGIMHEQLPDAQAIREFEDDLLIRYVDGFKSVAPLLDRRNVIKSYELRSVALGLRVSWRFKAWISSATSDLERRNRKNATVAFFEILAERIEKLITGGD
jgi:hypothetical protein